MLHILCLGEPYGRRRHVKSRSQLIHCNDRIFGVYMPLIYGEGNHAFDRLREMIERKLQ
jgi:hypothetical protein